MSTNPTCLLEKGCTCPNTTCERWGDCVRCIRNHAEVHRTNTVHCMREIAQAVYGAEVSATQ